MQIIQNSLKHFKPLDLEAMSILYIFFLKKIQFLFFNFWFTGRPLPVTGPMCCGRCGGFARQRRGRWCSMARPMKRQTRSPISMFPHHLCALLSICGNVILQIPHRPKLVVRQEVAMAKLKQQKFPSAQLSGFLIMYVCIYMKKYVYICLYMFIYVYICLYMHTHFRSVKNYLIRFNVKSGKN